MRLARKRSSNILATHRLSIGQTLTEYVLIVMVAVTAVVGMQIYMKRSIQAKVKDVADSATDLLAGAGIPNVPQQYEPYYFTETVTPSTTSHDFSATETFAVGGAFGRAVTKDETTRTGNTKSGVNLGADDAWN